MKRCSKCQKQKSLDEFHNRSASKDGKQSICKKCNIQKVKTWQSKNSDYWQNKPRSENYLMKQRAQKYQISVNDLNDLLEKSKGICAICKTKPNKWLEVDHSHQTMKVRGMLCGPCNRGIGIFNDDPEMLLTAAKYLQLNN